MADTMLSPDCTIANALDFGPAVAHVLIANRTACVGCYLARFCTLRDSAAIYNLEWRPFLRQIQEAASRADST